MRIFAINPLRNLNLMGLGWKMGSHSVAILRRGKMAHSPAICLRVVTKYPTIEGMDLKIIIPALTSSLGRIKAFSYFKIAA